MLYIAPPPGIVALNVEDQPQEVLCEVCGDLSAKCASARFIAAASEGST